MPRFPRLGWLLLPSLFFSGCASNAIYEDAMPLEAGKSSTTTAFCLQGPLSEPDSSQVFTALLFERQKEFGLGRQTDAFYKYTFPLNLGLGLKHSLVGDEGSRFGIATGGSLGIFLLDMLLASSEKDEDQEPGDSQDSSQAPTFLAVKWPIYLTAKPVSWLSLTLSPNVSFFLIKNEDEKPGVKLFAGLNGSLKLGNRWGLNLEGSLHHTNRGTHREFQAAIAFFSTGKFEKPPNGELPAVSLP